MSSTTSDPAPDAPPGQPPRVRQTWVDQARWVAITLVVIGHVVGLLRGRSDLARAISDFVYTFHIAGLVLLAGWGARRQRASGEGLTKIFWQLLVPYVVFQLLAFAANRVFEGAHPSWSFTSQTFGLWFLVALAAWRLLGPWFHGLRWPVLPALALALLAGLSPRIGDHLSLSRIAFFLPVFVAGPWVVDRVSHWRTLPAARAAGGLLLAGWGLWVAGHQPTFDRTIFFGRDSYDALGQGGLHGVLARLAALALTTVLAVCLLVLVPGRPGAPTRVGRWAAEAGRHTMYPYLLHLPLLTVLAWSGLLGRPAPTIATLVGVLAAVAFCVVTVLPPVRFVAGPFVEPRTWAQRWLRPRARRP
ncbi:acyltransferase family protein [Angustibacter luteus]|uniref:Acyltransferase family protein n=1 Tax=Angustibacter luteus TaxID=658456 RepID=A0ABW1JJK0_9ACTN